MRYLCVLAMLLSGLSLGRAYAEEMEAGLLAEYFNIGEELSDFPDVKDKKVTETHVEKQVNVEATQDKWPGTELTNQFYVRWTGSIKIAKDGKYKFYTNSDDGSRLSVDGKQVVDNGGQHAMEEKDGEVELKAGDHEIKIEFFENGGDHGCIASWEPAGAAKEVIPAAVFTHKKK